MRLVTKEQRQDGMMDIGFPASRMAELAALMISGGDSRLALDPHTGRSKYHCPLLPEPDLICLSSCTASPMSMDGWLAATAMLQRLAQGSSIQTEAQGLAAALRSLFGLDGIADVLLTPSGTDAALLVTGLLAAEHPGTPITSIMVAPSETGSGVPSAAAGCHFSDLAAGVSQVSAGTAIEGFVTGTATQTIALRDANGHPRQPAVVDADFAAAIAHAPGRPVVHLMDGSKTGLMAPATLPASMDVVVDACQMRLPAERLRSYIRRGWPVLITGSKFFGGPAFSGAILFPSPRYRRIDRMALPRGLEAYGIDPAASQPAANCGTVLRWAAALDEIARYLADAVAMEARLAQLAHVVTAGIAAAPGLVAIAGREKLGIFTVAVRGSGGVNPLLNMVELRKLHRRLADAGMLLGQPVEIAAQFGALRIALGARNIRDPNAEWQIERSLDMLQHRLFRTG